MSDRKRSLILPPDETKSFYVTVLSSMGLAALLQDEI